MRMGMRWTSYNASKRHDSIASVLIYVSVPDMDWCIWFCFCKQFLILWHGFVLIFHLVTLVTTKRFLC